MTAGVPIRCSELPLDFDLDQPTAQLCAITLASAMTFGTPLSWLVRASAVLRSYPALARPDRSTNLMWIKV